jgi:hypothetical protein
MRQSPLVTRYASDGDVLISFSFTSLYLLSLYSLPLRLLQRSLQSHPVTKGCGRDGRPHQFDDQPEVSIHWFLRIHNVSFPHYPGISNLLSPSYLCRLNGVLTVQTSLYLTRFHYDEAWIKGIVRSRARTTISLNLNFIIISGFYGIVSLRILANSMISETVYQLYRQSLILSFQKYALLVILTPHSTRMLTL